MSEIKFGTDGWRAILETDALSGKFQVTYELAADWEMEASSIRWGCCARSGKGLF